MVISSHHHHELAVNIHQLFFSTVEIIKVKSASRDVLLTFQWFNTPSVFYARSIANYEIYSRLCRNSQKFPLKLSWWKWKIPFSTARGWRLIKSRQFIFVLRRVDEQHRLFLTNFSEKPSAYCHFISFVFTVTYLPKDLSKSARLSL